MLEVSFVKKGIITILAILSALILLGVSYFLICGGEAEFENFNEVSADYETIVTVARKYYNESDKKDMHITLVINEDRLFDESSSEDSIAINLNEKEKQALKSAEEAFMCLWVTDEYVIFWENETKYYGLVYSEKPLTVIMEMKNDWYDTMEYHRINGNWYEIGVFGR